MGVKIDLTGQVFGRLSVIGDSGERASDGTVMWSCGCSCGAAVKVYAKSLRKGHTRSCGCLSAEVASSRGSEAIKNAHRSTALNGHPSRTHGQSRSLAYVSWCKMLSRCGNEKDIRYPLYGGAGVSVCDRWKSFEGFYADMGDCPPDHSIDRKDNSGNYEPDNCRWATSVQQARNTSKNHPIEAFGETRLLCEWAELLRVNPSAILHRISSGWPADLAVTLPKYARLRGYL